MSNFTEEAINEAMNNKIDSQKMDIYPKRSNSTQNDWEKRFWEYYEGRKEKDGYINPSFLLLFIAKELADARREVKAKIEKLRKDEWGRFPSQKEADFYSGRECGYNEAIDDVLATLKKEETP